MLSPWPVSHVLVTTHTDSHAPSSSLVTRLLRLSDSGDFWSPQRALSLTQVWSSSWSPTLTANITLMDPCFLIIRCTVHFLEPFLLYFSFYQTWGSYWQYCGTCKLWAGPGPLTVSSCDGEKLQRLLRSGVGSECRPEPELSRPKNVVITRVSVPHPDTASTLVTTDHGGRVTLQTSPVWHPSYSSDSVIVQIYLWNIFCLPLHKMESFNNNSISFINCQKNQEVAWVFF